MAERLHVLLPKEERLLALDDRELLSFLNHRRFRGLWFCRFAGRNRRIWYVTFLDNDDDFSETNGDPSWRLALQSAIEVIQEIDEGGE